MSHTWVKLMQIYQTCWIFATRIWTNIKVILQFVYLTILETEELIKKNALKVLCIVAKKIRR